ncbi:MAG: hypothetical protein K8R92_03105 [Planctomycetes bacterium]|nr:hypothetical protein [Planctomycetota bacterium]
MRRRATIAIASALFLGMLAPRAAADGGQVIAIKAIGEDRVVLMVNPSQPCVGPVKIIVRASPRLELVECTLSATSALGGAPIQCAMAPDPDGLGLRAIIQCDDPALWKISVQSITAYGSFEISGEVMVAPTPPRWESHWPWLLSWVPFALLLLVRQSARRHAKHYEAADGVFSVRRTPPEIELRP